LVNNQKILGMLGLATKAGKIVAGMEATKEAVAKQKAKIVIIAQDASEKTKKNLMMEAAKHGATVYQIATIEEISQSIGKKNKAIVGVVDKNFAQAIEKNINGGDGIG